MREQFYIAYRAARMGDDALSDNARIIAAVQTALSDDGMESQLYRERCRRKTAHELRIAKQRAATDAVRGDLCEAGLNGDLRGKRGREELRSRASGVRRIRHEWVSRVRGWSYAVT